MNRKELEVENEQLTARVKELEEELERSKQAVAAPAPVQPSKSKQQAEAALKLLQAGPVTTAQLKEINPKYPSDPIYWIRSILKMKVVTHRSKDGNTTYSLPTADTDQKPSEDQKPTPDEKA
jgi:cell division septum initiation protein DivIVA